MKAIVYTSQTGFTRRYAELLAAKTDLPAYDAKTAKRQLPRGSEIFYMGWLIAGEVKGLKAALDRYTVRGVAIVGISPQANGELWTEARINGGASDDGGRIFYLRGGYAPEKLGGIYRLMMGHMAKTVIRQVEAKGAEATELDREMAEVFRHGGDYVREEALEEIAAWIREGDHTGVVKNSVSVEF